MQNSSFNREPQPSAETEVAKLRMQLQQAKIREIEMQFEKFLASIKKMIEDQAALCLPSTLSIQERQTLMRPQVFISYAWEKDSLKLKNLQTFLGRFKNNLEIAGVKSWLDLSRMIGDIGEQMLTGIRESQYVILMGTERYAERTVFDSKTNVRKELDFALSEAKKSADFLLPIMLEGDYGTTFPEVGKYLIHDGRSWFDLEKGRWRSFGNYIKKFTECEPLGMLPCLLGLNRYNDYPKYREECLKEYRLHLRRFELELSQISIEIVEEKKSSAFTQPPGLSTSSEKENKSDSSHTEPVKPVLDQAEIHYQQGRGYERKKDYLAARQQYQLAADLGLINAITCLGMLALSDETLMENKVKAYQFFLEAAQKGHQRAMLNLAKMLDKGDGILKDQKEALFWYQKSGKASEKRIKELSEKLNIRI